jgi:hypothetical protein
VVWRARRGSADRGSRGRDIGAFLKRKEAHVVKISWDKGFISVEKGVVYYKITAESAISGEGTVHLFLDRDEILQLAQGLVNLANLETQCA